MGVLSKQSGELAEQLTAASATLATRADVDEDTAAVIDTVRNRVTAMTPSEQEAIDPRLLDQLQNGLLRAWQASDTDDAMAARRSMRVAVEQIRQALVEIAEDRPVAVDVPAKDVARWVDRTLGVPRGSLADLIAVSPRTFGRWVAEEGTEPSGDDELRLRMLARAVAHLRHVLTGPGVVAWMRRPHPQLDGQTPVELLGNPEGGARVVALATSARSQTAS